MVVAISLFIFLSAASTSRSVISGTSFGSVWIMVLYSLVILGVGFLYSFYDVILIIDFSTLSVISLTWRSFCVLLTFLRLFGAMVFLV